MQGSAGMKSSQRYHAIERYGSYAIRPARTSDHDRLEQLLLALQNHLEASNPDLWRMRLDARRNVKGQIAGRLAAENSCALVAEHDEDGVVGVIFGRIIVNNRYIPSRVGQVDQVFVCPEHRRSGVGSQLVAMLCRYFAAEDVDDLSLRYVQGNQEAAQFWTALGFSPRIVTAGTGRRIIEERLGQSSEG
jgi:GNAT superfamily N-acetyltransferase